MSTPSGPQIARQFTSLSWHPGRAADWDGFARDFLPAATLYAAARPAAPQSVSAFIDRMQKLSATSLPSLQETLLGTEIHVFGNVAMAIAACAITENGSPGTNTVEMLLLVKTEGAWRIASQAWDRESETARIPTHWQRDRR